MTTRVNTTLPQELYDELSDIFPHAASDSERVALACHVLVSIWGECGAEGRPLAVTADPETLDRVAAALREES